MGEREQQRQQLARPHAALRLARKLEHVGQQADLRAARRRVSPGVLPRAPGSQRGAPGGGRAPHQGVHAAGGEDLAARVACAAPRVSGVCARCCAGQRRASRPAPVVSGAMRLYSALSTSSETGSSSPVLSTEHSAGTAPASIASLLRRRRASAVGPHGWSGVNNIRKNCAWAGPARTPVCGVVARHGRERANRALRHGRRLRGRARLGRDGRVQQADQQRQAAAAPERGLHILDRQAVRAGGLAAAAQAVQRLQRLQVQL